MDPIEYLFDSSGNWIAFRRADQVFAPTGEWIGWTLAGSDRIVDVDGNYFATIVEADRLFREVVRFRVPDLLHPGYPGRQDAPDHPGYPGRYDVPVGMEDVRLLQHV